jgi:MFS family permease
MFYQLKSFDGSLPDSTIAGQAGMMASSFTAAQFCTAMMWGRISDSDRGGRKMVIMIGLLGTSNTFLNPPWNGMVANRCTAISVLGFGFSKSFFQAMCFRTIGGALNGNVGVMRTMISEIVREKK